MITSISPQATLKHLASLSGRDSPLALDAGILSRDVISKATSAGAKRKMPGKAITTITKRVRGSINWFKLKNLYGYVSSHDTQKGVFIPWRAITQNLRSKYQGSVGNHKMVE